MTVTVSITEINVMFINEESKRLGITKVMYYVGLWIITERHSYRRKHYL